MECKVWFKNCLLYPLVIKLFKLVKISRNENVSELLNNETMLS